MENSHIHPDHAGGAGDVAAAFSHATVVVSEIGARHMVDPTRLNDSARRVYGELYDSVHRACTPIARRLGVGDGHRLHLGAGRHLELLYTPGHAKHHIAAFDPDNGALFVGDSVGVRLPGMAAIRPGDGTARLDLVLAKRTLRRSASWRPKRCTWPTTVPWELPLAALEQAADRLRAWWTWRRLPTPRRPMPMGSLTSSPTYGDAGAVTDELVPDGDDLQLGERLELLNGYRSNAMGRIRCFRLRGEGRAG